MKIQPGFGMATLVCLWFLATCDVRAEAPDFAPQPQSLTIAVNIGGPADRSLQCVAECGPAVPVTDVAFSPDGKILAATGYREVLLWDLANAKLLKRIGTDQLTGSPQAVVFLADGKSLAVGEGKPHGSGAVRIFEIASGGQTAAFEEPKEVVYALALSPDGKSLVAGAADNQAYVWDLEQKKLIATLEGHAGWILGVSFSPDGKLLTTASTDNSLRLWKTDNWEWWMTFAHKDVVRGAGVATDGKQVYLAVGGPNAAGLRARRTDSPNSNRPYAIGGGMPLDVEFDAKANKLYIACSDNTLRTVATYGRVLTTFTGHKDWVYSVALSPDGKQLASGSGDGTVKLWNAADGKLLATLAQLASRTDRWLILSDQGYVAASSDANLQWKTENLTTPPEEIPSLLNNPEQLVQVLTGNTVQPPALK